ncbi:hypothetical protein B0H11DRAFT_2226476 [Mycena galericulata]|nr:hypothetical protein B0H11DRAFT_2226476 [Mycena galericulata]
MRTPLPCSIVFASANVAQRWQQQRIGQVTEIISISIVAFCLRRIWTPRSFPFHCPLCDGERTSIPAAQIALNRGYAVYPPVSCRLHPGHDVLGCMRRGLSIRLARVAYGVPTEWCVLILTPLKTFICRARLPYTADIDRGCGILARSRFHPPSALVPVPVPPPRAMRRRHPRHTLIDIVRASGAGLSAPSFPGYCNSKSARPHPRRLPRLDLISSHREVTLNARTHAHPRISDSSMRSAGGDALSAWVRATHRGAGMGAQAKHWEPECWNNARVREIVPFGDGLLKRGMFVCPRARRGASVVGESMPALMRCSAGDVELIGLKSVVRHG